MPMMKKWTSTALELACLKCCILPFFAHWRRNPVSVPGKVCEGKRPAFPEEGSYPATVSNLIASCWAPLAVQRPSAMEVLKNLKTVFPSKSAEEIQSIVTNMFGHLDSGISPCQEILTSNSTFLSTKRGYSD